MEQEVLHIIGDRMKRLKELDEKKVVQIIMVGFFIFNFVQIFMYKMFVQSDDFGYIADAAFFAGYNWNPYTGDMTQYFNIGFPITGAWVFKVFDDPIWIYRGLLFVMVIWQSVLMYLVYRLIHDHLRQSKKNAVLMALLYSIGSMAPQNGLYFMAEIPFAVSTIAILYILAECSKLDSAKRSPKKSLLSALCAVVLAYSYSVHTRFLVLFVTVFLIIFLYRIICKKDLIDYISFIFVFLAVFLLVNTWVKYVQGTLYATSIVGRDVSANNALSRLNYIPTFLKTLFGWENLKRLMWNYACLLAVYTLLTGGLIWIVIAVDFFKGIALLKKRNKTQKDKVLLILLIGGIVSFFGMNALTAMNGVTNINEYKWITYFRYAKPFVGILFIVFLYQIWNKRISKPVFLLSSIGMTISIFTIFRRIIFVLEHASYADVSAVGWMKYYFYNGQQPREYFKVFAIVALIIFVISCVCFVAGKNKYALIIFAIFSVALTLSENLHNVGNSELNYEMTDKILEFMEVCGDEIDVPIYFMQGSFSGKIRYALGKTDMNYIIESKDLKAVDFDNALVFVDVEQKFYGMKKPKYFIELDEYEYIYTSNENVYLLYKNMYR